MNSNRELSPQRIFDIGQAFRTSKTLLSAVELDLFTVLAMDGPLDHEALQRRLGLHPRGTRDFLDALVAIGLIERDRGGKYSNTPEADLFLDRSKPTHVNGFLDLCNFRLYDAWSGLTAALRSANRSVRSATGDSDGQPEYRPPYHDAKSTEVFLTAMTASALRVANAIAMRFPWTEHRAFVDVGAAEGCLSVAVALAHAHLMGRGFDLPAVQPFFERYVHENGVADRMSFVAGDFLSDPLPAGDVVVFGRVLHNWDLATKKMLLAKAYAALPPGGRILVYERLIDDERTSAPGLLASLNMLVTTPGGFDFTGADCMRWMREAGLRDPRVEWLEESHSMVIATK